MYCVSSVASVCQPRCPPGPISVESEEGEHAVAKVFVDDAVVGEDRVAELLEETVEGVNEVVRELALGDGGEIANVAEK